MNKMFEKCKKVSFAEKAETIDRWLNEERIAELLVELGFEEDKNFSKKKHNSEEYEISIEFKEDDLLLVNSYTNRDLPLAA